MTGKEGGAEEGGEEEGGEEEGGEEEGGEEEGGEEEGGEEVQRKSTSTCTEMTNIIRCKHSCLQPDCSVVDMSSDYCPHHYAAQLLPSTTFSDTKHWSIMSTHPRTPMQTTTLPGLADTVQQGGMRED